MEHAAKSVDISPNGQLCAVGLGNGEFLLLEVSEGGLREAGRRRDRSQPVQCVRWGCVREKEGEASSCLVEHHHHKGVGDSNMFGEDTLDLSTSCVPDSSSANWGILLSNGFTPSHNNHVFAVQWTALGK